VSDTEPMTPRSSRVKAARKLTRRAFRLSAGQFLAEGPQAVREALRRDGCVDEVFATGDASAHHADLHRSANDAGVPWHLVDDAGLAGLAETVNPQGVVAVCRFVDVSLADVLATSPRLVAMGAHLRDPGNAGTLIRSADAVGADAVILAGESVDPYNGKTVRSSVGSLFHLPVVFGVAVEDAVAGLKSAGLTVLAADGGGDSLDDLIDAGDLEGPTAWLFGNEAWGLRDSEASLADRVVGIPLYGAAESLNVASAAAVCLYASARAQRSARR
jgi:TrmH family RNA methyltransferase